MRFPTNFIGITKGYHYGLCLDFGWNSNKGGNKVPIYSIDKGKVISTEYQKNGGNVVYIEHNNGFVSYYTHLSKIIVKVGQIVELGEQIGNMGNTGNKCNGYHLHLGIYSSRELMYKNSDIDPFKYLEVYEGQEVANSTKQNYGDKIKYHQEDNSDNNDTNRIAKTTSQLWLHRIPNFKTESNLALMEKGIEVKVLGEEKGLYKISIEGYSSKNYIKSSKTTSQLNLRSKANLKSSVVALMNKGINVEILGEENNLYHIKLTGYASKNYIK